MAVKPLPLQRQLFVEHYCASFDGKVFNATKAAIAAGYSKKHADRQGHRLVEDCRVKQEIAKKMAEIVKVHDITREELVSGYRNISMGDIADYAKWADNRVQWKNSDELTKEQTSRIKELRETVNNAGHRTLTIVLHDRKGGLDGLAKIGGHIVERREHSGLGGKAIEHKHGVELDLTKLTSEDIKELKRISELAKPSEDKK